MEHSAHVTSSPDVPMKTTLSPSMAWRDLQEIIDPDARREQARELYEYTDKRDAALGTEDDSLTSVHGALARHPGSHPRARLQLSGIVTLAVLLAVLDTPLQGVLNLEQFPSVPHWIWWIVAPALAAGGTFFTHGAAIAFLHDELRPARSLRLCRTLAWTFFVLVMLAASVLLYTRVVSADGAESILGLTTVCLWIVTEALPPRRGAVRGLGVFPRRAHPGRPPSHERQTGAGGAGPLQGQADGRDCRRRTLRWTCWSRQHDLLPPRRRRPTASRGPPASFDELGHALTSSHPRCEVRPLPDAD